MKTRITPCPPGAAPRRVPSGGACDTFSHTVPPDRVSILRSVRSVVVKLGTQVLSTSDARLDTAYVASIAQQIARLRQRGTNVTIVSSGAVGAGLRELKLPKRPTDLAKLQAVAAVGQRRLMDVWADAFEPFGLPVAQILLTREDIDKRARFLNLRNTIHAAHEMGTVPVINENDTISTDELIKITFGDNDILAALVASALRADLLILLSVVDGVMDNSGKPVRLVSELGRAIDHVRSDKSPLGKGGMPSKFEAARIVTDCGECMIVADGRVPEVLPRLLGGEELGTLFIPSAKKRSGKSRWIGTARPLGIITIDDGAARAITEKHKSLLPAGIVKVEGDFSKGDIVEIRDSSGKPLARGLSNYPADDVERIRGKKTADVRALLKERAYDEVVHRDNLVIV